jgi:endonuclease-3 related protein
MARAAVSRPRDIPDDPGLERTPLASERGPYVGRCHATPRRFAKDAQLERLLRELARGYGPQRWWPAETPFEVMIGAVLTQNTAWRNVELALARLKARTRLTPARILSLGEEELAACIRPSGYFRVKARKLRALGRWYLAAGGLRTLARAPLGSIRAELLAVWGIGPETADSILCYAAGRRVAVVDAYTRRVLARHGFLGSELPYESVRAWLEERLVDSQAVLEEFHALCVRVGHASCRPTARCEGCAATPPRVATAPAAAGVALRRTVPFQYPNVSRFKPGR